MRRILFHALAILSLILLAATLVVWLRSYWREDAATTGGNWSAESSLGSITICRDKAWSPPSRLFTTRAITPTWTAVRQRGFWFHFRTGKNELAVHRTRDDREIHYWHYYYICTIPYWSTALLFAAIPTWWFFVYLRRRRIPPGHCPTCRYDLRAHAPGQKCPECGTIIETPAVLKSHP